MLIIVFVFSLFSINAEASEADNYIERFESLLPEGFGDILSDEPESRVGPEALIYEIRAIIEGKRTLVGGFFLSLVGCLLLMALAGLCPDRMKDGAERGVSLISALFIGGGLVSVFLDTSEALLSVNSFFSSLIPVLSAITLAGGGVKSAAVGAAGMNTVLSIVGGIFTATLSSVCGFSLAMGLAASTGGEGAGSIGRSSKNLFMWIFGIATALLMGTLSLQTLVSGVSDCAAMRTAKYMASSSIPIVGGTVSASLSTLASGLSYAKGIIGGASIFVILVLLLSPLLVLILYRLALSVSVSLAELLGIKAAANCFSSFRGAVDLAIAVYALSAILYIFEIILFIKSGVAAL